MRRPRERLSFPFPSFSDGCCSGCRNLNAGAAAAAAGTNPYTGRPYSDGYYKILAAREKLPVWQYKKEFMETLEANKSVVLEGETGSGKTTQVSR